MPGEQRRLLVHCRSSSSIIVLREPLATINGARLAGLNDHSIITPFDDQCAGRCYHFNLCRGQSVDHRRQRRAARACARSQRLSNAALPEPDLDLILIDHAYEFDVRSFGEGLMGFDLRTEGAPINVLEIVHENAAMWVSHRHGGELNALSVDLQPLPDYAIEPSRRDDRNFFTRESRRAHFGIEDHARADQAAAINGPYNLNAGARRNSDFRPLPFFDQFGRASWR